MLKNLRKSRRGFTIIEVVLVLAIAGLIFLMVFLALPALQRSQRDTQRRNSLGEFRTQIVQYQSNNSGKLPKGSDASALTTSWRKFLVDYLDLGLVTENDGRDQSSNDEFYITDSDSVDVPFVDPDGEPIYVYQACIIGATDCEKDGDSNLTWEGDKHRIYVYMRATCEGENAVEVETANTRLVAFRYKLEGAGVYCGNN